jgi:hypothetical protein
MRKPFVAAAFALIVLHVGAVLAAPDADPWENVTTQKKFKRPVTFEQEVGFAFIDAGTQWSQTTHTTTLVVDGTGYVGGAIVFDAGVKANSTLNAGFVSCDGGTPTPTATVAAGANCVCARTTGAICSVSSTTLSVPCVAGNTGALPYLCF